MNPLQSGQSGDRRRETPPSPRTNRRKEGPSSPRTEQLRETPSSLRMETPPSSTPSRPTEANLHRRSASVHDTESTPRTPRPRLWAGAVQEASTTASKSASSGHSPASPSSESHQSALSPGTTDRVFPMRSVISVDPSQTPQAASDTSDHPSDFPGLTNSEFSPPSAFRHPERRRFSVTSTPSQASEAGGDRPKSNRRSYGGAGGGSGGGSQPSGSRTTSGQGQTQTQGQGQGQDQGQGQEQIASPPTASDPPKPSTVSQVARDSLDTQRLQRPGQIFSDAASSIKSGQTSNLSNKASTTFSQNSSVPADIADPVSGTVVTSRFKHVVTAEGHAVITGRDGETLQRCEDEPIHIPGAVQSFGLLIALREEDEGKLVARVVSENSKAIIGFSPRDIFALDSFTDILSEEQADNLLDHIDFIREEDADPATNGPEVFTISIRPPRRKVQKLWCAIHINERNPGLIICEFEIDDDQVYPLVPPGDATPEPPEDTLNSNPTAEELAESTINTSRPLRVLRSARKRKGEAAAMEVFNIMSQVQEQLASAPSLESFLKVLVGVVKELTGFHRVMVYQFDQAWNGRVVTELLDPRATKDLYKGLHFPASDIPKQARDLYKINKVRLLYDRDLETARLVCRETEDLETPVDLTFSYLRAMSPIHIKYLANMAVRSSMSISINAFNELWGLISCHTYGSKGMRVSFPIRKMCRLVGDSASQNIERLSYASRLQARKLINTVPTEKNPAGYIIASSEDLLQLFDADFGLLSIRDETKILGKLEQSQEALAMLEYLRVRKITSVLTSQDLQEDFPDLKYPPGFHVIAGLLLVPLAVNGTDFIVFFRTGQLREVKWAGNPYEKFVKEGTEGYLEPRKSFRVWSETVVGKCREWTDEQVETAAVLCLVYGKFIEVWRQKEAALQSSQLTRLLLANSAHEVRTPLNAIINYLEIALEGQLDNETRDNLARSHSASKSLIYVINDLLDLTKTEEGGDLNKDEVFDLPSTVREATDMFASDAKRKQIEFEVIESPSVPRNVLGDARRVRQAVSNVTANAIKHTFTGGVRVELAVARKEGEWVDVDIAVEDTGHGMSPTQLDSLFRELEQVHTEGDENLEDTTSQQHKQLTEGKEPGQGGKKRALGLGLALVARIVRNMNGQLRLKSEEGKGSRFTIQLPFMQQQDPEQRSIAPGPPGEIGAALVSGGDSQSLPPPPPQPTTPPPAAEGEMMLVQSTSAQKGPSATTGTIGTGGSGGASLARKSSRESLGSMKTQSSGKSARSDVDRLIDAIQEPHMITRSEQEQRASRPASLGSKEEHLHHHQRRLSGERRPSWMNRVHSHGGTLTTGIGTESLGSPGPAEVGHGQAGVFDSKTPIKPIKMPGDPLATGPTETAVGNQSKRSSTAFTEATDFSTVPDHYRVLVAEDDPVNSKIIKKRLEKTGHEVALTVNGEECASMYGEKSGSFDVILMDMQMPIVDGLSATKMIRSYEKSNPQATLSPWASRNGRVPIFAVSASLEERDRQQYRDVGFDGWILKPIDFKRLNTLVAGIADEQTREQELYKPNHWEQGGWFHVASHNSMNIDTNPSGDTPVTQPPQAEAPLPETEQRPYMP